MRIERPGEGFGILPIDISYARPAKIVWVGTDRGEPLLEENESAQVPSTDEAKRPTQTKYYDIDANNNMRAATESVFTSCLEASCRMLLTIDLPPHQNSGTHLQ